MLFPIWEQGFFQAAWHGAKNVLVIAGIELSQLVEANSFQFIANPPSRLRPQHEKYVTVAIGSDALPPKLLNATQVFLRMAPSLMLNGSTSNP